MGNKLRAAMAVKIMIKLKGGFCKFRAISALLFCFPPLPVRMRLFPIRNMTQDSLCRFLDTHIPSKRLHKIILRICPRQRHIKRSDTHQIKENGMINEVVLSRLEIRRRRKIDSEVFTSLPDSVMTSRQPNDIRMVFYMSTFASGEFNLRDIFGGISDRHARGHRL